MSTEKKLTPEQALAAALTQVEKERVLGTMSDEEIDTALAEQNVTPEMIDASMAKDRALVERLEAEEAAKKKPTSNVRDIRSARRWPVWSVPSVGAFAVAATVALFAYLGPRHELPSAFYPTPTPTSFAGAHPPLTDAQYDRMMGYEECFRGNYEGCLYYLDQAKALEPEGELSRDVERARNYAKLGLAQEKKP